MSSAERARRRLSCRRREVAAVVVLPAVAPAIAPAPSVASPLLFSFFPILILGVGGEPGSAAKVDEPQPSPGVEEQVLRLEVAVRDASRGAWSATTARTARSARGARIAQGAEDEDELGGVGADGG